MRSLFNVDYFAINLLDIQTRDLRWRIQNGGATMVCYAIQRYANENSHLVEQAGSELYFQRKAILIFIVFPDLLQRWGY